MKRGVVFLVVVACLLLTVTAQWHGNGNGNGNGDGKYSRRRTVNFRAISQNHRISWEMFSYIKYNY